MNSSSENTSETETKGQGQKPKTCRLATASAILAVAVLYTLLMFVVVMRSEIGTSQTAELVAQVLFLMIPISTIACLVVGILALVRIKRSDGALRGKRRAILGIGVSTFLILFVAISYLGARQKYGRGSELLVILCKNNLYQLGGAMRAYAEHNNGVYCDPNRWCDLLVQDSTIEAESFAKLFVCRCAVMGGDDGKCHYAMNPGAGPHSPNDIVLLFETRSGWNQFGGPELLAPENHAGKGCNILFNDYHVSFVRTEELAELKWKQKENIESFDRAQDRHRTRKTE